MTDLSPDEIDLAELEARALYTKAWNVAHLADDLWKIARHDAVAAAEIILEREKGQTRKYFGRAT